MRFPCRAGTLLGTTLALILALGVGLMWAPSASAQAETCQASGSLPLTPNPSTGIFGESAPGAGDGTQGRTTVRVANTSSQTAGAENPVDARLFGTTTFLLACTDSTCAIPIPGALEFTGCTDAGDDAVCNGTNCNGIECVDGGDGVTVLLNMPDAGVLVGAGQNIALVRVNWEAIEPPSTCINNSFFQRAEAGDDDLVTADTDCTNPVSGSAAGSADLETGPVGCPECQTCNTGTGNCDLVEVSTPCVDTDGNECTTAGCDGLGACNQQHILPDSTPCGTDTENECATPGCDGAGNCDQNHIPVQASTPCTDTENECANAGCDGLGSCDQSHTPVQASTPCTDTENECASAGCDGLGSCDQSHTPVQASTPCADTDGNECTTAGCDGLGACDQRHILPESTPCTDTDGQECTTAGCDGAGNCDQEHISDCGNEICRTPGFWATHAGTEKDKSRNLTKLVIQAGGGCLEICGEIITNTKLEDANSAEEALCVAVQGTGVKQLARQLTAAALNCIVSNGNPDCTNVSIQETFQDCNTACAEGNTSVDGLNCIAAIDCFNNGGTFNDGICTIATNNCHDQTVVGVCFVNKEPTNTLCSDNAPCAVGTCKPGPAGSSDKCNAAKTNNCAVVPFDLPGDRPDESGCDTGTKLEAQEFCED